jgi:hypothetical protein
MSLSLQKLQNDVEYYINSDINSDIKNVSENNNNNSILIFKKESYNPEQVIEIILNYRKTLKENPLKFEYAFQLYFVFKYYEENIPDYWKVFNQQIFGDNIINSNPEMKIEKGLHYKTRLTVFRIFHLFMYFESKGYVGIYKKFKITSRDILLINKDKWDNFIKEINEGLLISYKKDLKAWSKTSSKIMAKNETTENEEESDSTITGDYI